MDSRSLGDSGLACLDFFANDARGAILDAELPWGRGRGWEVMARDLGLHSPAVLLTARPWRSSLTRNVHAGDAHQAAPLVSQTLRDLLDSGRGNAILVADAARLHAKCQEG